MSAKEELEDKATEIRSRVSKAIMSPSVLTARMSIIDDFATVSSSYKDPNYLPFYYHCGRVLNPHRILCIGVEAGVQLGSLLMGCERLEEIFCLHSISSEFKSPRTALFNIKASAGKKIPVSIRSSDLKSGIEHNISANNFCVAIIPIRLKWEAMMNSMEFAWSKLRDGGFLVVDRTDDEDVASISADFLKSKSANYVVMKTRYGSTIAMR